MGKTREERERRGELTKGNFDGAEQMEATLCLARQRLWRRKGMIALQRLSKMAAALERDREAVQGAARHL